LRIAVHKALVGIGRPRQFFEMAENRNDDGEPDSRRPALIGLAVILVLVIAGYFLVTALRDNSKLEDCLMSGRRNCAPIEVPASNR
jgi:hypothetical protein